MKDKRYRVYALGLLVLLAILSAISCGEAKPVPSPAAEGAASPSATVAVASPSTESERNQSQATSRGSGQEMLVPGALEGIISSPEPDKDVNVVFVLDASGSMLERINGRPKIDIAKEVIGSLVQELPASLNLGLTVYGHRYLEVDKARSCQDIQSLTPLGQGNGKKLTQALQGIRGNGWTSIAKALESASQELVGRSQGINSVVLLSDGQETCGGKPADVARGLKEGPAGLTVHAIGFTVDEATRQELQEIAQVSGGTYNEAQDAQGLLGAVQRALVAARSGTFLRGEATGEGGRRVSTSLWLQDPRTGNKLHEFRSWVDSPVPPGTYDILLGTAPRMVFAGMAISAHTRTIIKVSTGALRVELADAQGQALNASVHLKNRSSGTVLRSFSTWYNQPVLPGAYDLEIDSNPKVNRPNVSVSAQGLTVVSLGRGSLRLDIMGLGGERPNWEAELQEPDSGQAVHRLLAGREQEVRAGSYRLVIFSVPQMSMEVKVTSGESKVLQIWTGVLRVELVDSKGGRVTAPARLVNPRGEASLFSTWQEAFPVPGDYDLVIAVEPELRRQVRVSPTDPTILQLRLP